MDPLEIIKIKIMKKILLIYYKVFYCKVYLLRFTNELFPKNLGTVSDDQGIFNKTL